MGSLPRQNSNSAAMMSSRESSKSSDFSENTYSSAVGIHKYYQEVKIKPGTSFDRANRIILSCQAVSKNKNYDIGKDCSVDSKRNWNSVTEDTLQVDETCPLPSRGNFKTKRIYCETIVNSVVEKLGNWNNQRLTNSTSSQNVLIDTEYNGEKCIARGKPDLGSLKNIGQDLAYHCFEKVLRWRLARIHNHVQCPYFPECLPFVVIDGSEDGLSKHATDSEVLKPVGWIATNVQLATTNLTITSQVFSIATRRNSEQVSHVVINHPDELVTLKLMLEDGLITDEEYKQACRNFILMLRKILSKQPNYAKLCTIFEDHNLEEHIQNFYQDLQERNDSPDDDGIQSDLEEDGSMSDFELNFSYQRDKHEPISRDIIVVSTDLVSDEWHCSESLSSSVTMNSDRDEPLNHNMIAAVLKQNNYIDDEAVKQLTDEGTRSNHQQNGMVLRVLLLIISYFSADYSKIIESFDGIRQRARASKERDVEQEAPRNSDSVATSSDEQLNFKYEKSVKKSPKLASEPKRAETRSQVIANILFTMIEDKKYFPFDFEVHLRTLVFEHKQEVGKLTNKEGLSLLHGIAVSNRPQFLLPLFRAGCWSELRALPAGRGPYEGKTAENMCIDAKSRKLQKEMDTFTKWEKSLNQVHISARKGDFGDFKKVMKCSEDLHHEVDDLGCTSLYWAVVGGNVDIIKLLLAKKVDYTKVNCRKETLLHVACMVGHKHLLVMLVKDLKMDVMVKDAAKKSALLRIAENGDEKSLSKLMKFDLKKERLGQLLAIAGHYGRLGFLKKLIDEYGVDPSSKDDAGKTAFMRACEQSRVDVVKYLLSKGVNIAETDVRRRNVLHMAADGATAEMVEYLLNELKNRGETFLKQMLNHRDKYIGGELCMLIRGKDKGRDSWHYVEVSRGLMDIFMKKTRSGTIDVAKYGTLLHSGWGVDPDDESAKEIEKRFETRRNAQMSEDLDVTPLHIAAFKDKEDVAELLMNYGSDLSVRDKFGLTPLHIAAMRGNLSIVKSMITRGAEHDVLDNLVKTPIDVAEDNEHKEVANFIRSYQHVPVAQNFRDRILPNIQNLLAEEHIQQLLNSGEDIRTHLINTLRDLTIDINESLLALGSGPVLEESAPIEFTHNELKE